MSGTAPRLRPAARADIAAAVEFLASRSRSAAQLFVERLGQAFDQIRVFPRIGPERDFGPPVGSARWWSVSGFPYLIFYRVEAAHVDVLRVLHGARDVPDILAGDVRP